jgi:hypothetical protein
MIDVLLKNSDLNNDGFIDYTEFKQTENPWKGNLIWTVHIECVASYVLQCKNQLNFHVIYLY